MKLKAIVLGMFVTVTTGCSTIAEQYEADPIMEQQSELLQPGKDVVDTKKLSKKAAGATDMPKRNALINELVTISDRVCSKHQAAIIANGNTWNVVAGTTTNFLSALGTVVGGESAKAALAAGATFSSSSRSLVNEEVYVESVGTAIVRAISVAREKYYAELRKGMARSVGDYPVEQGLRDVQEYHRRCSFYYGLVEISKSLEQRKKSKAEIDDEIEQLLARRNTISGLGGSTAAIVERIDALTIERVDAPR